MPDDIDYGQEREIEFQRQALEWQLARGRVRYEPVVVHGIACCHDCEQPLPPHRIGAGICVECLTDRERRQKGYAPR